jgi:branched-subunit amino acid aminotransferase/4-amino-4-deoxychorismate lyase
MVTYLSKKSYQHRNLEEVEFQDLWGDNGVFTTMWIFGKPPKILFYKEHIKNLMKSLKAYKLNKPNLEKKILKLLKLNITKNKKYNHLLRVAINNKIISISLRKRVKTKLKFNLRLIKYKRIKPEFKNLKYQVILKYLSKMNPSNSDIGLCDNNKILESGTSNILFVKKNKIFSPINKIYKGITFKFFENKLGKFIKKDILIKFLKEYYEIIIIGYGKGVTSINTINNIKWKRKSLKFYKILLNFYMTETIKCSNYR